MRPASLKDDDDFGPFEDPQLAEAAQNNFTHDFSEGFSFPSSSSRGAGSSSLFDLDDEFADTSTPSAGFSFGNAPDDDDDFGEFQGVGLEVVVNTKADGTMVSSAFTEDDPFTPSVRVNGNSHYFSTSSAGSSTEQSPANESDSNQETPSGDGNVTPPAANTHFDDNFGSSFSQWRMNTRSTDNVSPLAEADADADIDDLFSFQMHRGSPIESPDGENSSNVSNALSLLERSFGKVTVTDEDQRAIERGLSEAMSSETTSPSMHEQ